MKICKTFPVWLIFKKYYIYFLYEIVTYLQFCKAYSSKICLCCNAVITTLHMIKNCYFVIFCTGTRNCVSEARLARSTAAAVHGARRRPGGPAAAARRRQARPDRPGAAAGRLPRFHPQVLVQVLRQVVRVPVRAAQAYSCPYKEWFTTTHKPAELLFCNFSSEATLYNSTYPCVLPGQFVRQLAMFRRICIFFSFYLRFKIRPNKLERI